MIKNLWKQIKVVCGNHGEEVIFMEMKDGVNGKGLFYACPKYYPEARSENEKACINHISLQDFEKVVDYLSKEIENEMIANCNACLSNHEWNWKFYQFKVISHTPDEIIVSVKNKKAVG